MKIFTIGFTKRTAQNFFTRLRDSEVLSVIDTRINRASQLSGFAKEEDLKFFLSEINSIPYLVEEKLAPSKILLKSYRDKEIGWEEYARRYIAKLEANKIENHFRSRNDLEHACLLCSEHEPAFCHRRLAAEYLRDALEGLEIEHL